MHRDQSEENTLHIDIQVRELLGLEPQSLTFMDPDKAYVGIGLHEFMRATIERAMSSLWAPAGTKLRLLPDGPAKALRQAGWWDAKTYNLSTTFAYGLVSAPRRARGLPHLPLCPAERDVVALPRRAGARERTPMASLVSIAIDLFEVGIDSSKPDSHPTIPTRETIPEMLGLPLEVLARPCHAGACEAADAIARDADGQAVNGLSALLMTAFRTYRDILTQPDLDDTALRFQITDDARYTGVANARHSNIINLLLAGLLSEAGRDLGFVS